MNRSKVLFILFVLFILCLPVRAEDGSSLLKELDRMFKGDLSDIQKRKVLRVLVSYNQTNYFTTVGRERGFEYELIEQYKKFLIEESGKPILVVYIPMPFNQLLDALNEGYGDIAAAGLAITPDRQKQVAFTDPYLSNVSEIIVTHSASQPIKRLEDLSGRRVYALRESSYVEHLKQLNVQFSQRGLTPIQIIQADPYLQTEDLLEMVNVGIYDWVVADSHIAQLWSHALDGIILREDLAVHKGGKIGWAVRKNNPHLLKSLNEFVAKNKKGTLIGNILFKRYYINTQWAENPLSAKDKKKYDELSPLFQKYGGKYNFDWLLLAAQGYQESKLDQSTKSYAGAVGIMQLLPSTAAGHEVNIPNIYNVENNIHAGVKYLAYIRDRYFSDPEIAPDEQVLFSLAAYNAGPARVQRLRQRAKEKGLDPNTWFYNVALVAPTQTSRYVASIYKYYLAYSLVEEVRIREMELEINQ
jgi:membrane-bound lytic murein transglycosylase MltF